MKVFHQEAWKLLLTGLVACSNDQKLLILIDSYCRPCSKLRSSSRGADFLHSLLLHCDYERVGFQVVVWRRWTRLLLRLNTGLVRVVPRPVAQTVYYFTVIIKWAGLLIYIVLHRQIKLLLG